MSKYILGRRAQSRSEVLRYSILLAVTLILVATLQVSLFSRFRLLGAVPDLMICTVLCFAYFDGLHTGAIAGIAGGFLIEAIGSTGVILLPLFYLLLGYLTGHYARTVVPRSYLPYLVYLGLTLILRMGLTLFYACISYRSIDLPLLLIRTLLPELLVTAIAGCVIYFPMRWICGLMNKR